MKQLSGLPIRPIGSSNLGSVVLRLPLLGFYLFHCVVLFLFYFSFCIAFLLIDLALLRDFSVFFLVVWRVKSIGKCT